VLGRADFSAREMAQPFLVSGRIAEWRPARVLVSWLRRAHRGRRADPGSALEPLDGQVGRAFYHGRHAGLSRDESGAVSRFAPAPVLPVAADHRTPVGDGAHEIPDLDGLPAGLRAAALGIPGQYRSNS